MVASCAILIISSVESSVATVTSATISLHDVTFRAVLCFAPRFSLDTSKGSPVSQAVALPECAPSFRLSAKNLDVRPSVGTSKTIRPDPIFLHVPNGTKNAMTSDVILPGIKGAMANQRYVLGPAQLSGSAIKTAKVVRNSGQWGVSYTLTASGSETFNSFAKRQFHALIAIVANGEVYSVPIIQPASTSFTSFEGNGLIEGNFTKAEAVQLAAQM
jgi:hypothetical protein